MTTNYRVTGLTPSQHEVLHRTLAETLVEDRPPTSMLTRTTYSFDKRDAEKVAEMLSVRIEQMRTLRHRGELNALHSLARKLERLGVRVER